MLSRLLVLSAYSIASFTSTAVQEAFYNEIAIKNINIKQAFLLLATTNIQADDDTRIPLRIAEGILGHETKAQGELGLPEFSFRDYFHGYPLATWLSPTVDAKVKEVLLSVIPKDDSSIIADPTALIDAYRASANLLGSFCSATARSHFGDNVTLLPITNVWRFASAEKSRLSLISKRGWFTKSDGIKSTHTVDDQYQLKPLSIHHLHVAVGLLRGLIPSTSTGNKQFQKDVAKLSKHHAVFSSSSNVGGSVTVTFKVPADKLIMHLSCANVDDYPNTDVVLYYENEISINPYFSKILQLNSNRKSLPSIVDEIIAVLNTPLHGAEEVNTLPLDTAASKAVMKELRKTLKRQSTTPPLQRFWEVDFGDNLSLWRVKLFNFDPKLPLSRDMLQRGVEAVQLEVRFWPDFPNSPPFVRVVSPRFLPFARGGGGHVTAGGSICLELLTSGMFNGWSSSYTMEDVFLQVVMALSSNDPSPARLDRDWNERYGIKEAREAYIRVVKAHGWSVPRSFGTRRI